MYRYSKIAATGVGLLAAAAAYSANQSMENDVSAINGAKVALSQAISAAEQHVQSQGKATRAELEHTKVKMLFDVEVATGAKTFDVTVDTDKGTVLAATEDNSNHEDDNDQED